MVTYIIGIIVIIGLIVMLNVALWRMPGKAIKVIAVIVSLFLILGLSWLVSNMVKGSSTIFAATKKIGMEKVKQDAYAGVFKKGELEISYNESKYNYLYVITDHGDMNLNYHQYLLDSFIKSGEGTTQMIYTHLVNEAKSTEQVSKILIEGNHIQIDIEYDIKTDKITYKIEKVTYVNYTKTDSDGYSQKVYNPDYNRLYLVPKLRISHLSDDNYNIDIKLLNQLFNNGAADFQVEIDELGYIVYTYSQKQ